MKKKNLMLDIETLNTTPDAVILAIGAVTFDKNGIGERFYVNISLRDNLTLERTISEGTFYWWCKQDREASKALTIDVKDVVTAFELFTKFLEEHTDPDDIRVWGNGAQFDNVIVRHWLTQMNYPEQKMWKFWNDRCFRTYLVANPNIERLKPDVAHNALSDAEAQAKTLINYWVASKT